MAETNPVARTCFGSRNERPAWPELLGAVEAMHRVTFELLAHHLGRFPVLGDRMRRDADSAREFAERMARGPALAEAEGEAIARGVRLFLESLLFDCREFLRQRGLRHWSGDDLRALEVRGLARRGPGSVEPFRGYLGSPESAANTVICLIQHAAFLVDDRRPRPSGRARPGMVACPAPHRL
jgi:hypothetical protein